MGTRLSITQELVNIGETPLGELRKRAVAAGETHNDGQVVRALKALFAGYARDHGGVHASVLFRKVLLEISTVLPTEKDVTAFQDETLGNIRHTPCMVPSLTKAREWIDIYIRGSHE